MTKTHYTGRQIADMIGVARENMQTLIELNALGYDMQRSIETQQRRINGLKRMQMTGKIEMAEIG